MLTQLVRDLMALGVELRVKDGSPSLHVPDGMREPKRSRAYKAARAAMGVLAEHRHQVATAWMDVAAESPDPVRCVECRAWVFCQPEGRGWAYCEYLWCPGRTDAEATAFQRWKGWRPKMVEQFHAMRRSLGQDEAPPIPD